MLSRTYTSSLTLSVKVLDFIKSGGAIGALTNERPYKVLSVRRTKRHL